MFNFYIDNNAFPNGLKKADIDPVYKKVNPFDKTYYRHISILPLFLSEAFECCLYDQFYEYIFSIQFTYLFRKHNISYKYKYTNISYNFKQKYVCR